MYKSYVKDEVMQNNKLLKIENFGPIISGFTDDNGYMKIPKVSIIIGPQGTGKSSVAKLYSTLTWIEKALTRGDFSEKYVTQYNRFVKIFCAYQNIQNYFKPNTFIEYKGEAYTLTYTQKKFTVSAGVNAINYLRPQIVYIPAERNLLSVIENAENVKGIPECLHSFLLEYNMACKNMKDLELPIGNANLHYDVLNKVIWLQSKDYKVRLKEASSGFQSVSPMLMVTEYLHHLLIEKNVYNKNNKSLKEEKYIQERINEILKDDKLDIETRRLLIKRLVDVENKCLVSIIEEPEQNLYPSSQRSVLFSLLKANNEDNNKLLITTHSPYIINYLSLAIKAKAVENICKDQTLAKDLEQIVLKESRISSDDVIVYNISENGKIHQLPSYDGMPSDENELNENLGETNDLFNQLLDIEEKCRK